MAGWKITRNGEDITAIVEPSLRKAFLAGVALAEQIESDPRLAAAIGRYAFGDRAVIVRSQDGCTYEVGRYRDFVNVDLCPVCQVEYDHGFWPNHYRTRAHRESLHAKRPPR